MKNILIKVMLLSVCTLYSCSNDDVSKFWFQSVNDEYVQIQVDEGKVVYHAELGEYVLTRTDIVTICGTWFILKNKKKDFLNDYLSKKVRFSGKGQLNKLLKGENVSNSDDYYFFNLESIEIL